MPVKPSADREMPGVDGEGRERDGAEEGDEGRRVEGGRKCSITPLAVLGCSLEDPPRSMM